METVVIPKKLVKEGELILIPRRQYEEMVRGLSRMKKRAAEEADTDEAIRIHKKEKKLGKLQAIKSLADLSRYIPENLKKDQ